MPRHRMLSGLFVALFAALFAGQIASCTDDQSTNEGNTGKPQPCSSNSDCDSSNPCQTGTCTAQKACEFTNRPDGPLPTQTLGDCLVTQCKAGKLETILDAVDILDDNEPCTDDLCTADGPVNMPRPDGTECTHDSQYATCKGSVCMFSCDTDHHCNDFNPCTDDHCDFPTGICTFTNLDGLPAPWMLQIQFDCNQLICQSGQVVVVVDDSDLPIDENPCTDNICTNGVPSNPPREGGVFCTPGNIGVCDGAKNCVECTEVAHCSDIVEDECTKRSCVNNVCKKEYMGTDTIASPVLQTPGDCNKVVCDGAGGTTTVNDDADKPDDDQACTIDSCNNGTQVFVPLGEGTQCGIDRVCNALNQCAGCGKPSDCPGTDDTCKTRTCLSDSVCGFDYAAAGTVVPGAQTDKDCKVVVCNGAGKSITKVDQADVPVDATDCTEDLCSATGNPSNPYVPWGNSCTIGGNSCDGNGVCQKSDGVACTNSDECINGNCVDGYCCDGTCALPCRACNVPTHLGQCWWAPKGSDDAPICEGTTLSCDGSGECKKENGQPCALASECSSGNCSGNPKTCQP